MSEQLPLLRRVARTMRKHGMLDGGGPILVAVSGGADSVCLLRVLTALCQPIAIGVGVAHINHGWRADESDGDEAFVRGLAGELGLKCAVHRDDGVVVGNLEAAARNVRQRFLREVADAGGYRAIAVAHTRDDRNETFFLNLLRGAGADGLVAMRPASNRLIRPMIDSTRSEIVAHLEAVGQTWREDRTNQDPRFARNDLRRRILPMLAAEFNPRLREALARTADILEAESEWMEGSVGDWLAPRTTGDGMDLVVRIDDLAARPDAFIRRTLRRALREAGSSLIDIGFGHVESVRSLLEPGKSGKVVELPDGIRVERSFDTLRFFPEVPPAGDYEYELPIPGRVPVPEFNSVFEARLVNAGGWTTDKPNATKVFVDGESLGRYVKIRNWKSGDFYRPEGLAASKLKMLFQKERIPRRRRRQWPVLVARSSIVWVASFPVSRDFVPTGHSQRVVEFETSPL